jgi:hypothetical protein
VHTTSGADSGVAGWDTAGRGVEQQLVQLFNFGFIFFAEIGIADEKHEVN